MEITLSQVASKLGFWDLNPCLSFSKSMLFPNTSDYSLEPHSVYYSLHYLSFIAFTQKEIIYFLRSHFTARVCTGIFENGRKTFQGTKMFSWIFFPLSNYI